jgi:bla regulator protein blaR1
MPMLKLRRGPLACATGIAGLAAVIVLTLPRTIVQAQTRAETISTESPQVPEWQKAAGDNLSFEVASIRLAKPGTGAANFPLDISDSLGGASLSGRLVAEVELATYIQFAYKLFLSRDQRDAMLANVPKWVSTDRYAINAKAEGSPSKDQMRVMMQSLLADRFKLAVHFERQETSVLALVLDKPGITGAKLYPHSNGLPCDVSQPPRSSSSDVFPPICDQFMAIPRANKSVLVGSRNMTLAQIVTALNAVARSPRPFVDQTGLGGRFDFTLEWTPESNNPVPTQEAPFEEERTTFQQALREQLGLKLTSTTVLVDSLVVDHVEMPSEN